MFSKKYWLLSSCLVFGLVQASSKEFLDFIDIIQAMQQAELRHVKDEKLSAFTRAIEKDKGEKINLMLAADPRIINRVESGTGLTPLFFAINCDDIDLVARFLSMGADINHTDSHGSSPLAYVQSLQMADFLLAQPNINLDLVNVVGEDVLAELESGLLPQEKIDGITKLIKAKRLEKLRWEGPAQVTGAVREVSRKDWIGAVHLFARRDL